ncbi:Por secretion system C-terminal sorting domain-containing protein [Lutibacter oricola]|uniref:Por secretion system C-terminal sorting domain-containing protein n=1 Tax=Lutibacter oricola TaxID=762486 RepID=A0A1H2RU90_9FLAO|nr:zinc-dependent metalloprotease family protein [Lutibacter oricola]SDW22179.1 Por secretion system C-terminal sorting domain-containing protein [Lutibacter oricola]
MKIKSRLSLFFFIISNFFIVVQAQDLGVKFWQKSNKTVETITDKIVRKNLPEKYKLFNLNLDEFKSNFKSSNLKLGVILSFPNEKGNLKKFEVFESSIMDEKLQEKHPDITSYIGKGIDNPADVIRFSITKKGVHAMVFRNGKSTLFIDPFSKDLTEYIVYSKSSLPVIEEVMKCYVEEKVSNVNVSSKTTNANDGKLRTYRLAIATTGEYSQYHLTGSEANDAERKATVLSAIVTTMTRVNGIFERDLGLKMILVANNTDIIYLDGVTDPFTNDSAGSLINESQTEIDSKIGFFNYDIGHTFSTSAGGLAQLNSPCTSNKAKGVTGTNNPIGDAYDVDYVAHEMGHQFGANHTFNTTSGFCGSNSQRNSGTAVEPGSGSTIMAYAGICSPDNVQNNSDSYFHTISIGEMWANISGGTGSSCATLIDTSNDNVPVSNAGANYTIPKSTPFVLTGSGSDADGDAITYCWEQVDTSVTSEPLSSTVTDGPAYRSIFPSTSEKRYFPSFETVLNGNLFNSWEVTPSVGRTLDFALTVRDNNAVGGQSAKSEMTVTVDGAAGPFEVLSQNTTGVTWQSGTTETITWDVANTDVSPINCTAVNIVLSIDGGLTYPIVLASNTANDGSEPITVPNNPAPYCRVMVVPTNNIFYSINSENFAIDYTVSTTCKTYSASPNAVISDEAWTLDNINIGDDMEISDLNLSINITHNNIRDVIIRLVSSGNSTNQIVYEYSCDEVGNMNLIFDDQATPLNCGSLDSGSHVPVNPLSVFNGGMSQGNWQLQVGDGYTNGIEGVLNNWSIEVCTVSEQPLAVNEFEIGNFSMYPNPSSGIFNINFLSKNNSDDIKVKLFDLTGRLIELKNYTQNGISFSKEIDFSHISSGTYIIKLEQGNQSISKHLVKY